MDTALLRIVDLLPRFISDIVDYSRNDSYICGCIREAEVAKDRVARGFRWVDTYRIAAEDIGETIYDLFEASHGPGDFLEAIRSLETRDPTHRIDVLSRAYDRRHYRLVVDPLEGKPCAADLLFYEDPMLFNLEMI